MASISLQSLRYIISHVVLPPQLPSSAEASEVVKDAEKHLLRYLLQSVQHVSRSRASDETSAWNVVEDTVSRWITVDVGANLSIELVMKSLAEASVDCIISLMIKAQNAALIIRVREDGAIFESFELSPQQEPVMQSRAALQRVFPTGAVWVPNDVYSNENFRQELSHTLRKLDVETVEEMIPQAKKAGHTVAEIRDTTHPGLVTEMLMAALASLGRPISVPQITKRTRDDVLWDNCLLPWRRSPFWLTARVTIQTCLAHMLPANKALICYKNLIIALLTKIMQISIALNVPLDLCTIIQAKIARRCVKLGGDVLELVNRDALAVGKVVKDKANDVWKKVQASETPTSMKIDVRSVEKDTAMSLISCGPYLDTVLQLDSFKLTKIPDFIPRCSALLTYQHDGLPNMPIGLAGNDILFCLAKLEIWVGHDLLAWTREAMKRPIDDECTRLAMLARQYDDSASSAYADSSEQRSMMLLTLAELWRALDMITVKAIPLMAKFPPEVSTDLFCPLLLARKDDMHRLKNLEDYIALRQRDSNASYAPIFSDPSDSKKTYFPSLYFNLSRKHMDLRSRIEEDAREKRRAKGLELETKQKEFEDLKSKAAALSCTTQTDYYGRETHAYDCPKCEAAKKAKAMRIDIHEWPLPENEAQCRAVMLELDCPSAFAAWRDLTWMLLQDLGRTRVIKGNPPADTVTGYTGLAAYKNFETSRITLASDAKSMMKSHYSELEFPTSLAKLCLRNALRYSYFDSQLKAWLSDQTDIPDLAPHCYSKLPEGPYRDLQYAADCTAHHQSKVIANQMSCSKDLTLHELIAFGSLRADGEKTQWLNIQRELGASNLTLNTEAVCTLITQAASQAGTGADTELRLSHGVFNDAHFSEELLAAINFLLASIETNWQSEHVMMLLIVIVLRIVGLSKDQLYVAGGLETLRKCRQIISSWKESLENRLESTSDEGRVQKIQQRLLKIGLLGKHTYNIDKLHHNTLLETEDDVRYWVLFSIVVHNNTPGSKQDLSADLRRQLLNDSKISFATQVEFGALVSTNHNLGLDRAVKHVWSDFRPCTTSWTPLDDPCGHWLQKETLSSEDHASQLVSYDLLEGELLVNGRPLGRLPREYIHSDLYVRVFGSQIFSVFASNMPGMLYMTAREVEGYQLHFGHRAGSVVIRMGKAACILEAIPHDKFCGDFPSAFVSDYTHWLDISRGTLEFRLLGKPFNPNTEWQLFYNSRSPSYLKQKSRKLVDVRSDTATSITSVLAPLEVASHIHITTSGQGRLRISLPRLGLTFSVTKKGHLECQELRKIVDPNQSIGTMTGLRNKLVLCERGKHARQLERIVIIPLGTVAVSRLGSHVTVSISSTNMETHVNYFRYQVDSILGRLRGDGTLLSRLFQAYLHALTSHLLPDLLTHRTGTEEALSILRSQIKQALKPPDGEVVCMLKLLSALTPSRVWYPKHLEVMQQVQWSSELPFLSQHDDFAPLCAQLLSSGNRFEIFYPDRQQIYSLDPRGAPHLMLRAKSRHSNFRCPQFGGNVSSPAEDKIYASRDKLRITDRGLRTYQIAALIAQWPSKIESSRSLSTDFRRWGVVSGFGQVFDTSKPISDLLKISHASCWAPLYGLCRRSTAQKDKFKLLFAFAVIAYGKDIGALEDLRTLLAFAFLRESVPFPNPPSHQEFRLGDGSSPQESNLTDIIKSHTQAFTPSDPTQTAGQRRQEYSNYNSGIVAQAVAIAQDYIRQWPCTTPVAPAQHTAPLLKMREVHAALASRFAVLMKNKGMEAYLKQIQAILDGANETSRFCSSPPEWQEMIISTRSYRSCPMPDLNSLFSRNVPMVELLPDELQFVRSTSLPVKNDKLLGILSEDIPPSNTSCHTSMRRKYKADLEGSYDAFCKHQDAVQSNEIPFDMATVRYHFDETERCLHRVYSCICEALKPITVLDMVLYMGGAWPRITLTDLIRLLASVTNPPATELWKECLLKLGSAVAMCQRARRLVLAAEAGKASAFFSEAENLGCRISNPRLLPDWLLIEIENDFLIRPVQSRVAEEMMQPTNSSNTLVQLNMGEGKSSVIVPIVAVALANGKQLARVIVLKSLTRQMIDTLTQRLGGLVGRQIYHMPFSRKTPVSKTILVQMQELYEECMHSRGVLVTQPEFLLSFQLMGIERLTFHDNLDLGRRLLRIQDWLKEKARDLLDESDEILDVKFQLIYTIGSQRNLDGQPERWLLIQGMFDLVEKHAAAMASIFPNKIQISKRSTGCFPTIRLLSPDLGNTLILGVLTDVVESKLPGLNLENWNGPDTAILRRFLQDTDIEDKDCSRIIKLCGNDESLTKKLLLVRGLIAHGVLLFIVNAKRWSVNFGLDLSRCLVAVPYRAKGVPALTAEFGHPDVTVALTCLAYYYSGLSDKQLKMCLELLQKDDDPSLEYQAWTQHNPDLPPMLRNWNAVNLEDEDQCYLTLFPAIKYSKKVADFYMANIVFPREGKEFEDRLSSSGWDIPAELGGLQITTGFSGTNDNRFLLPSSISQQDLPQLHHTSGKVLDYVARPQNLRYVFAKDDQNRQLSAEGLLRFLNRVDGTAQILIDVGAQVLETKNEDVARDWLRVANNVDAGIYFDADDKVMVVSRGNGKAETFATSSFSSRIDRCLVYLDEVHTRGTDLALPRDARAFVTLGPRLTKDRLVQACMRLRQLAHGQSLLFVAPPEVHNDIVKVTGKIEGEELDGYDVIKWALTQSLSHLERSEPLRIMQGLSYYRRQKAAQQYSTLKLDTDKELARTAADIFVEKEEQSLHDLYAPSAMKTLDGTSLLRISAQDDDPNVKALMTRWNQLDPNTTANANVQEEHEREVAHEVEQETEIQRPPAAKPLRELVDEKLATFIRNGFIATLQRFQYAHDAIIQLSSAAKLAGSKKIWTGIRVSEGFSSTVERPASGYHDDYLRPVNWVLTRKEDARASQLLIISQYEANQLMDSITHPSSAVTLHCYEPRITRAMTSVDSTTTATRKSTQDWLKLSPNLRWQLHLFAGQLYIDSYEEYCALRKEDSFQMVPLPFLRAWIGIRRRGQNFLQTHIGRIVSGWNLQEEDF